VIEIAGIRRYHLDREAVGREILAKSAIQSGRTSVTFAFALAGEENRSASITFPQAFAATPAVDASISGIDVGVVSITPTASGFTITVRDDKGTDYTTSQTATVNWIAMAV